MTLSSTKSTHTLYTDDDADRPKVICDSNGSVVLGLCKACGMAEVELDTYPVCTGSREAALALLGAQR